MEVEKRGANSLLALELVTLLLFIVINLINKNDLPQMPTSECGAVPVVWREGAGGYVGAEGLRGAEGMCGLWE